MGQVTWGALATGTLACALALVGMFSAGGCLQLRAVSQSPLSLGAAPHAFS